MNVYHNDNDIVIVMALWRRAADRRARVARSASATMLSQSMGCAPCHVIIAWHRTQLYNIIGSVGMWSTITSLGNTAVTQEYSYAACQGGPGLEWGQ